MNIPYENLELIPQLINKLDKLQNDINMLKKDKENQKLNLTKIGNVAKYLNCSPLTIRNMMNDGRLKERIHYKKELINKKIKYIFFETAIIHYKESL